MGTYYYTLSEIRIIIHSLVLTSRELCHTHNTRTLCTRSQYMSTYKPALRYNLFYLDDQIHFKNSIDRYTR